MPNDPSRILELEMRSEPVQEIIGRDPNWIVRWGITVVLFTVVILLFGTWIVKYPEIITARITVTTETPPIRVISRGSGKIVEFFVAENDEVASGDYLALLENTADYGDIEELKAQMESFRGFLIEPENHLDATWNKKTALGDIQLAYSDFLKYFYSYSAFVREDFITQKIKATHDQIKDYRILNEKLQNQKQLLQREMELMEEKFNKNKELRDQNLISETDLALVEEQHLQKKYALENADSGIVNNRIRIRDLENTIMELRQQQREQARDLIINAQEAFKRLLNEFSQWEQRYVLKAPTRGRVTFYRFWSDNQFVQAGDEVLTIVPDVSLLVGKIYLPQNGVGKVEVGQRIHIKFDSFPFREFGIVKGKVASISPVTQEDRYLINVSLPDHLKTNYNKELTFKYGMQGSADIITRDLRLIERIFNQFRYLFSTSI